MKMGFRVRVPLATAIVLGGSGVALVVMVATQASASAIPAATRAARMLLTARATPASETFSRPSGGVRLVLVDQRLTTAEAVAVAVVNGNSSAIYRSLCFVLEHHTAQGWRAVTRTHGVRVGCPIWAGSVQAAHSRQNEQLELYDDLQPGRYRITLFYRPVPKHWHVIPRLTRRDRFIRLAIIVHRAPARPPPHLSEQRLVQIAQDAAAHAGDPHPTLIQHAAGTRFEAVRVVSGDLLFEWNWSYLIAERGRFTFSGVGPRGGAVTGSVLTLVVDAQTGQVTDSGLGKRYPRLRQLGRVITDAHS